MDSKTFAFIDASNLFYGGEKSLGWRLDYKKLLLYLREKYNVSTVYYFGGVDIHHFVFDYIQQESVSVEEIEKYLINHIATTQEQLPPHKLLRLNLYLKRIQFYMKLKEFGYELFLKPVKSYIGTNGKTERKANCDVDMTLRMICEQSNFNHALFLSGDGDFLPVLKLLRKNNKEITILARAPRTAKEIKRFAGDKFRDFEYLRELLKYDENTEPTP
ncbi:NYN domain-containing protein [Candidatus Nomurabacteria bacterium]|nr:NYN domain-containing protein [Candidatus Nomurabacteria bacterium]